MNTRKHREVRRQHGEMEKAQGTAFFSSARAAGWVCMSHSTCLGLYLSLSTKLGDWNIWTLVSLKCYSSKLGKLCEDRNMWRLWIYREIGPWFFFFLTLKYQNKGILWSQVNPLQPGLVNVLGIYRRYYAGHLN